MIRRFLHLIRCRAVLGLVLFAGVGVANAEYADEDLMAVYLYRFAFLSDWQETGLAATPIEFCVTEESEVALRLKSIVLSKPDVATYANLADVATYANLADVSSNTNCHILYINDAKKGQVAQLKLDYPHALLVGSGAIFIQYGGMIAFVKVNNRIKPMISRENVAPSLIKLRAQLLSIAILASEATQ